MWVKGETHVGQKRPNNQDSFNAETIGENALIMVCDGMGGENGGAVASETAIETACAMLRRDIKPDMNETSVRRLLECAGAAANIAVYDAACGDSLLFGMGTTLVGALVQPSCAHIIHAGDSRAYLLRDDILTQLTVDHTVVQMLLERGDIDQQAAANHPQRHYITRAVGVEEQVRYDIFSIDLQQGDAILLCSDGLYNYVDYDDLSALLAVSIKTGSVSPLIDRANQNGGGDNITAVVCRLT